jgi:hypothetical protein
MRRCALAAGLLAAGVLIYGMSDAPSGPEQDDEIDLARHVQPILNVACVSCHLHGQEIGDLDLGPEAAFDSLVGVWSTQADMPRVDPGAPETSYLWHKLNGTHRDVGGRGERMPPEGAPLGPRQLLLIRAWIEAGAANRPPSPPSDTR